MKINFVRSVLLMSFVCAFQTGFAQYPDVPKEIQRWSDSLIKAATYHSDLAWAKALPIIELEEKNGKPYIPWAARPIDLPQSDIPAFPGAEGGGKFSFG